MYLIYSKSAASRILDIPCRLIEEFQIFGSYVQVKIAGSRPLKLAKQQFLSHFFEWRQQQAKSLKVKQRSKDIYLVQSARDDTKYHTVDLSAGTCTCGDFFQQIDLEDELGHKAICKHLFAVIS